MYARNLFSAIEKGDTLQTAIILREVGNPDVCLPGEYTPLTLACVMGNTEMIHLLIEMGADVNKCSVGRLFPTAHCINSLELMSTLIQAGADPNSTLYSGESILHRAAQYGTPSVVQLLLNAGSNVDACDDKGWTPLHVACLLGSVEVVDLLLKGGASIGVVSLAGYTALELASVYSNTECVDLIRSAGVAPQC